MRGGILPEGRGIHIHATGAQVAFDRSTELGLVNRKTGRDGGIKGLDVQVLHLCLRGQGESIRRIGPGDEGVGLGRFDPLHDGRKVLGAERVGFVVNDFKAGFLEDRPRRHGQLDAEGVRHIDHGHPISDFPLVAHFNQNVRHRGRKGGGAAQGEKDAGIPRGQFRGLVGNGGDGDLRIAVFGENRRRGQIQASAVGREDEIHLVPGGQPFHRLDGLAGIGAIVVFDNLDLASASVAHFQAAARVHLGGPQLKIRPMGDGGAGGQRAGLRPDRAELDHLRPMVGAGTEGPENNRGQQDHSTFHGSLLAALTVRLRKQRSPASQ